MQEKSIEQRRLIELFHETKSITYAEPGEKITLSSGIESDYIIDVKNIIKNNEARNLIGNLIYEKLRSREKILKIEKYDIVGIYQGGSMVGEIIEERNSRNLIKFYPETGEIEGNLNSSNYVAIEDVTTTAGNVIKCVKSFRKNKYKIDYVISLVDREQGAKQNLEELGLKLDSILTKAYLGIGS